MAVDDADSRGKGAKPLRVPPGESLALGGATFVDDKTYLKSLLEKTIRDVGRRSAASDKVRLFKSAFAVGDAPGAGKAGGGGGAHGAPGYLESTPGENELAARIAKTLDSALAEVDKDLDGFLKRLRAQGRFTTLDLLAQAQKNVLKEQARYFEGSPYEPPERRKQSVASSGLAGAAKDLQEIRDRVAKLQAEQDAFTTTVVGPLGGATDIVTDVAAHRAAGEKVKKEVEKLQLARRQLEAEYPILAAFSGGVGKTGDYGSLSKVASGDSAVLAEAINQRLDSIQHVRDRVFEVSPLRFPRVVVMTLKQMGIEPGTVEAIAAKDAASDEKEKNETEMLLLGLLGMTLGLLAAGPVGAAAGGLVGAGLVGASLAIGSIELLVELENYELDKAAANTAFDKALAISQKDPSLFWLAVTVVGFVIDVGEAAKLFARLSRPVAAAIGAGDDIEFGKAVRKIDDEAGNAALAQEVAANVRRLRAAGTGKTPAEVLAGTSGHARRAAREAAELGKRAAILARDSFGGTIRIGPNGGLWRCSNCSWLSESFADELADNPHLGKRVAGLEARARAATRKKTLEGATAEEIASANKELEKVAKEAAGVADVIVPLKAPLEIRQAGRSLKGMSETEVNALINEMRGRGWTLSESEVEMIRRSAQTKGGVWNLPDPLRGKVGHALLGENLPHNTKTIDRKTMDAADPGRAVATSIKTRNVFATSYRDMGGFWRRVASDADELSSYEPNNPAVRRILRVGVRANDLDLGAAWKRVEKARLDDTGEELTMRADVRRIQQQRREMVAAREYASRLEPPVKLEFVTIE